MKQKALLVGINDYASISDLRGCHNDITNVRDVLMQYRGFTNSDIRVVLDSRATEENVKARMEWLRTGAKSGDKIFFHFSGHGSQIRDRDGDELRDHTDEIICLYGMSWDGGYITDDYFDDWFNSFPYGVVVEVIFDSCHSGTGGSIGVQYRDTDGSLKITDADRVGRFLPPPLDIELRGLGENLPTNRIGIASFTRSPVIQGFSGEEVVKHHFIWSGCGESQTSADAHIGGSYNGAFSYFWCKHMREAQGDITRKDLLSKVRSSLRYNRYTQIPELTCNEAYAIQSVLA